MNKRKGKKRGRKKNEGRPFEPEDGKQLWEKHNCETSLRYYYFTVYRDMAYNEIGEYTTIRNLAGAARIALETSKKEGKKVSFQ